MKRKKTIRNIVIAAIVVVIIVAAVILALSLRKDGHNLNGFERAKTVATADGEKISMLEYAMMFDTLTQTYSYTSLSDEQLKNLQENAAAQALMMKIYKKEATSLGLTLTAEEEQKAKEEAQSQIDAVVENYTESLISSGSYSKSMLDKQVASYYNAIGMNQTQYYNYLKERMEANYYITKLDAYYTENGSGFSEEEILDSYHAGVDETKATYAAGQYSLYFMYYAYGYSTPLLFVPDGFFYVDVVEISKDSEDDLNALFDKVNNGEMTFDELLASEDNVYPYRSLLEGPYAIGDDDYSYVFSDQEAYDMAKALEIGEISTFIKPVTSTDEEGNESVTGYTGYMFRRAEGNICENGAQTGYVDIDHYDGIRASVESNLRQLKWLGDIVYTDAVYGYRGTLE